MFKPILLFALMSSSAFSQTIERRIVDIVYGDKVIRTTHQVVLDTELEVDVIPAEETKPEIATNVVITANDDRLSYLETNRAAMREQEIYSEVNRRTRDAPYTVLFTGYIPPEIQKKRMAMMPEVGLFGDQKDKLLNNQGDITQEIGLPTTKDDNLNVGQFSSMSDEERSARGQAGSSQSGVDPSLNNFINGANDNPSERASDVEPSNDEMLEKLIGG